MSYTQNISVPTGIVKTFGEYGISYIVGNPIKVLPDGDVLVSIEVPETGEKMEYKLSQINNDPEE